MEENKKKLGIAAIVLLAATTVGSIFYAVNLQKEKDENERVLIADKESVLKQLTNSRDSLNLALSTNTNLSAELTTERDKVVALMSELESAKASYQSLLKYKEQTFKLKATINKLMEQVSFLKNENSKLTTEVTAKTDQLNKSERQKDSINSEKEVLDKHVKKAAKINIVNLNVKTLRWKSEKMNLESDKAVRVDMLKTSFVIPANHLAASGDRKFFIQIIDPTNNVIGLKQTETFTNGSNLVYSETVTVDYQNQNTTADKNIPVKLLEKGTFFVNVFDQYGDLMGKTTFTLR